MSVLQPACPARCGVPVHAVLMSARTALVNAARGLVKSYGERLRKCGTQQFRRETTSGLSAGLRQALEPLLREVEPLNERIHEYDRRFAKMAQERYGRWWQWPARRRRAQLDRVQPFPATVQPLFSAVHRIILDELIPSMLPFPVFINPEPRSACLEFRTADPDSLLGCISYCRQLTNCPRFDTLLRALRFQQLPTVKFCNSFVLITIQIAGVYTHQQRRGLEKKKPGAKPGFWRRHDVPPRPCVMFVQA